MCINERDDYIMKLENLRKYAYAQLKLINAHYHVGLDGLADRIISKYDYFVGSRDDRSSRLNAINDKWFAKNATYLK